MKVDCAIRFRYVRGIFVGVNTAQDPTAEAWNDHCAEVNRVRHEMRGVLVYTEGGGPDSAQRKALRNALHEVQPPPTAILTASPLARGIITGLNWFFRDPRVVAFAQADFDGALGYLARGGILPRDEILHTLKVIAGEMGVRLPFAGVSKTGS